MSFSIESSLSLLFSRSHCWFGDKNPFDSSFWICLSSSSEGSSDFRGISSRLSLFSNWSSFSSSLFRFENSFYSSSLILFWMNSSSSYHLKFSLFREFSSNIFNNLDCILSSFKLTDFFISISCQSSISFNIDYSLVRDFSCEPKSSNLSSFFSSS